jgi:hypothetical protein
VLRKHEDQCQIDALMEKIRKKLEETMGVKGKPGYIQQLQNCCH